MNERRKERLAAFLQEAIGEFFLRECAFAPGVFVSVQFVDLNETASRAMIAVSVFPDEARNGVAEELKTRENEATHFVRGRLDSKYAPLIRFTVQ
jgi:ribosome-binding factor A